MLLSLSLSLSRSHSLCVSPVARARMEVVWEWMDVRDVERWRSVMLGLLETKLSHRTPQNRHSSTAPILQTNLSLALLCGTMLLSLSLSLSLTHT